MILKGLFKFLFSGIMLVIMLALIFSVCIFFFGGYLGWGSFYPFDGLTARIVFIAITWVIALMILGFIFWRRRRRDKEMTEEIVEAVDTSSPEDDLVQGEVGELRGKLREALTALRKSKMGRRSLYELPWYVMIGPPGAGKTTAIVNSGLNFPLAETMGKQAVGGVGGTRNCDWWFTDEAVLIDTAGRYTTQDSDADVDNRSWLGFLDLLKKFRKRQPINGALIAISISDLSLQDEETQKSHARAVRFRLKELRERLGVRFPVYVLFTKADLMAGFSEFFDNLGKEEREQVWGFTLPLPKRKDDSATVAAFDQEFAALLGRLNAQTLGKMQSETDHQRRSLIAGFPGQVASVRQVARDFLAEVFNENKFEQRHLLRGVYFTSGTQEGTPIDRLMMGMARTFGIGRQAIGTGRGTGRSYFLTNVFEEVMFPEAGLVSADDKVERRYKWSLRGAIAATILIAAGGAALWTRSYLGNSELLASSSAVTDQYIQLSSAIPSNPIGDSDLTSVVPALNTLRYAPANPVQGDFTLPDGLGWGLYKGDVVGDQAAQSYRAALNQHMLPRMLLRLEERMQSAMNEPDVLYEALKIYLMLGQQGPLNAEQVIEWMEYDWAEIYGGLSLEETRTDLSLHLASLLEQPMMSIPLNGPLIDQVRDILREMPMAQRIYTGILNSPEAVAMPKWRLSDIGGANLSRAMTRSSGVPLTEGIDGIFTHRGFRSVFLPQAVGVSEKIQNEAWVLGDEVDIVDSPEALAATARDVLDLYYTDYIAAYDQLLADLDIVPLSSLNQAAEVTNILSGPTSPIRNILVSVADETRLTENRSPNIDTQELNETGAFLLDTELDAALSARQKVIFDLLAGSSGGLLGGDGAAAKPPGYYVEERFAWLQQLTLADEGVPSQLDEIIIDLQGVYDELNKLAFAGGMAGQPQDGPSALARFQQTAARLEGPLERWASQIAVGSSGITAEGTRSQLNAMWQSQILPFCAQALDGKYPFNKRGSGEVKIADFQRLFAPGGMFDAFFNENLARHVDITQRPWQWKSVNGADLGLSDAVLQQFENAAMIRDAFFVAGAEPSVSFDIRPEALDPNAQSMMLEVNGQQLEYAHGQPQRPAKFNWPGQVGFAALSFGPPMNGIESTVSRDGDWAFFRFLDAAQLRNKSDHTQVIVNVGGRVAILQLRAGSVLNPFNLPALKAFNCPKSL